MNRCPISYESCDSNAYSELGLRKLSRSLTKLHPLPFSAQEQRKEAALRMKRMSIQGVQPKLSAVLNTRKASFEIVDIGGKFILKPQSALYEQVPENEDVSMRMAAIIGIDTPLHGMVYSKDGSLCYFIKRFDRVGRNKKLSVEDFSQLSGQSRDTKYDFTIEKMIPIIEEFCTFPVLEKIKFFRLILFSFLIGNEDMHIKNFSLITRQSSVEFSPAYDLLNTTLVLEGAAEEMALPIAGKRRKINRQDLFDYLGKERLRLNAYSLEKVEKECQKAIPKWAQLLDNSFLASERKRVYAELIKERLQRIALV